MTSACIAAISHLHLPDNHAVHPAGSRAALRKAGRLDALEWLCGGNGLD
jgi:hypothetical protein